MRYFAALCLVPHLFSAFVFAQKPSPIDGQHILSTNSPVTAKLRAVSSLRHAVDPLHRLIHDLATVIDRRVSSGSALACNLRAVPWLDSAVSLFEANTLGPLDDSCRSRLDVRTAVMSKELPSSAVSEPAVVIRDASGALAAATATFVQAFDAWNDAVDWSLGTFPVRAWDIIRGSQRCALDSAVAFRLAGQWYIRSATTNHPVDAFMPNGQRVFVEEFVRQNLQSALPLQREKWGSDKVLLNGSTVLTLTGGKAAFGYVPMGADENPALVEALRLNEVAVDQAQDAITLSNVAILGLPMVMSLIPLSFVADLNTCATLLYILLTDLVSCLPFLIKGVELVHTGSALRGKTVAYHIGTPQLGLVEIWTASCHGDSSFRVRGIIFILIAVAVMVLGLALEIIAARMMHFKRRQRRGRKMHRGESLGPFGNALLVESMPDDFESLETGEYCDDDDDVNSKNGHSWLTSVSFFGAGGRRNTAKGKSYDDPFPEPGGPPAESSEEGVRRWRWWG